MRKVKVVTVLSLMMSSLSFVSYPQTSAVHAPYKAPKNIIVMIGDGMGFNHLYSAMYYQYGTKLSPTLEKFNVKIAQSTYPAKTGGYPDNLQTSAGGYNPDLAWKSLSYLKEHFTDSGASATALSTGVKVYNNSIGMEENKIELVHSGEIAKHLGKSVGIVTSVPISHATPAGFVAHNEHRKNYSDLSAEMFFESEVDVLIGCGNPEYDNNGNPITEGRDYKYVVDSLTWGKLQSGEKTFTYKENSYTVADIDNDGVPDAWKVITSKQEFEELSNAKSTPKRILGIPKVYETLQIRRNGDLNSPAFTDSFNANVPSLPTIAAAAINVLDENPKGFFLMIEGGAIDWGGHANSLGRTIEEAIDFEKTIQMVYNWVEKNSSWEETLLIVTADHETGLLWGEGTMDKNFVPVTNNGKNVMPGAKWFSDNHSNSLVPLFAKGAGSDMFTLMADEYDPVRGKFSSNSELGQVVKLLLLGIN